MSETTGHTTNIFLGGNVMSEAELSCLAMGQATSNAVEGTQAVTPTGDGTVVHVIRHGKRGSHCLHRRTATLLLRTSSNSLDGLLQARSAAARDRVD